MPRKRINRYVLAVEVSATELDKARAAVAQSLYGTGDVWTGTPAVRLPIDTAPATERGYVVPADLAEWTGLRTVRVREVLDAIYGHPEPRAHRRVPLADLPTILAVLDLTRPSARQARTTGKALGEGLHTEGTGTGRDYSYLEAVR